MVRWRFFLLLVGVVLWLHFMLIPSFTNQYNTDCYLDPESKQNLEYLLKVIITSFEKHGVVYWLDYGSLLGAIRYHGIIPWDGDGDISFLKDDKNLKAALKEIVSNDSLISANTMIASYKGMTVDFMRWIRTGRSFEKYYPPWVKDNIITKASHRLDSFPVEDIGNRKKLMFLGIKAAVPEQYDLLIKRRYRLTHWISVPFKWKCYVPCFLKNDKSCS